MIVESLCLGPMFVNCYILAEKADSSAIIIDPGYDSGKINKALKKHKLNPAFIINTHGHYDHIGCDDEFGVPIYIHCDDLVYLKDSRLNLSSMFVQEYSVKSEIKTVQDNQIIKLNDIHLKVIHMPGHTPGGIALLMQKPKNNLVFTGDSLFFQGIGRSDFNGGNQGLLLKSIRSKLLNLADDTIIYPGHGPSSTIGRERRNNPFLN